MLLVASFSTEVAATIEIPPHRVSWPEVQVAAAITSRLHESENDDGTASCLGQLGQVAWAAAPGGASASAGGRLVPCIVRRYLATTDVT